MPRKYSAEFKEKAVHQVLEMVRLESCSRQRAYEEVGELLGVSHHTLRAWRVSDCLCAGAWFTSTPRIGLGMPQLVG